VRAIIDLLDDLVTRLEKEIAAPLKVEARLIRSPS